MRSQYPYALHIQPKDGLPEEGFYSIQQDENGFMWFAGNNGITRFDGVQFITYEPNAMYAPNGSNIKTDYLGRVWYKNFEDHIFYWQNDTVHAFAHGHPGVYLSMGIIDSFLFSPHFSQVHVYQLNDLKKSAIISTQQQEIESSFAAPGIFWVLAANSIYSIDRTLKYKSWKHPIPKARGKYQIYGTDAQAILVSKFNDHQLIYRYHRQTNYWDSIPFPHHTFIQNAQVIGQQLWLFTSTGVFMCNDLSIKNPEFTCILPVTSGTSVTRDFQNNYWITTSSDGVYVIPQLETMSYYLPTQHAFRFTKHEHTFYIGCKKGSILTYNLQNQQTKTYYQNTNQSDVYFIKHLDDKPILVSTSSTFLISETQNPQAQKEYNVAVKDAVLIDGSYLAFAYSGGVSLLELKENTNSIWHQTYHQKLNTLKLRDFLLNVRARSIVYDSVHQAIYAATNLGVYQITPYHIREVLANHQSVRCSQLIYSGNRIFAVTFDYKLICIHPDLSVSLVGEVPNSSFKIKAIKSDDAHIYLLTNYGLITYDAQQSKVVSVQVIPVPLYEVIDFWIAFPYMYILKTNQIIRFQFRKPIEPIPPRFYIRQIRANNQIISREQPITLRHTQNNIAIDFAVLNYGAKPPYTLFYRINQESWLEIPANIRTLTFNNLAPDAYSLQFKLNKTQLPYFIQFEIVPPLWRRIWFLISISILFMGLGYAYYVYRLKKIYQRMHLMREKLQLEKNLTQSMLTAIKSQMNPHFFFNALNAIQGYIFTNDKRSAFTYLSKFSQLTRTILEMSEKDTIQLDEEIKALTLYIELEKMRFSDGFTFQISLSEECTAEMIRIPSMIIQPFVENAITHGLLHQNDPNKKLSISFSCVPQGLKVTIDDNGIGRKKAAEIKHQKLKSFHESFSVQANQKRLDLLNKDRKHPLTVQYIDKVNEWNQSLGTTVILIIPI